MGVGGSEGRAPAANMRVWPRGRASAPPRENMPGKVSLRFDIASRFQAQVPACC